MPKVDDGHHRWVIDQLPPLLPRLWRFALTLCGRRDLADDLVQSTCQRAIERTHQFEAGTRLDRWIFAILVSIWKNELRTQVVRDGAGLVDAEAIADMAEGSNIERNTLWAEVLAEVGRLPEAQRETVFLVYVDGFSYAETAETLDIPVGTVMSRLAAARETLGRRLNAQTVVRARTHAL